MVFQQWIQSILHKAVATRCALIALALALFIALFESQTLAANPPPAQNPEPSQDYYSHIIGQRHVLVRGILVGHPVGSSAGDKPIKSGSVTLVTPGSDRKHPKVLLSVPTSPKDGSFFIDEGSFTRYVKGKAVTNFDVPDGYYEIWARARSKKPKILGPFYLSHMRTYVFPNNHLSMGAYVLSGGAQIGAARTIFYASDRTLADTNATDINMMFSFSPEREIVPCESSDASHHCYMTYGQLVPSDPMDPNGTKASNTPAKNVDGLVAQINAKFNNPKQLIIFVPGYNQNFVDPWGVAAHIVANFDQSVPVILYSWPSTHNIIKYLDDETNNVWDSMHFEEFLEELIQNSSAPGTINILAHSMGNRLVVSSLESFYRGKTEAAPINQSPPCILGLVNLADSAQRTRCHHFGEVIFAAPDVDSATFYEAVPSMAAVAEGLTLYGSNHDKALTLSRDIHGHCRAGLSGCDESVSPQLRNVNAIDASIFSCDFLDHSYWISSSTMQRDITSVFANHTIDATAPPRSLLVRDKSNPNLYAFADIDPADVECGADPNRTLGSK